MTYFPTAVVTNTHKNDEVLSYSCSYKHSQEWWRIILQLYLQTLTRMMTYYPTAVVTNIHKNGDVLSYRFSDKHSQEWWRIILQL